MKIAKIEDLHCDAGWRDFSFLKVTTDSGIVGWSEYNESYGAAGLTTTIRRLGQSLIGKDPRPTELITSTLYAITRQAAGGVNQQAIAAIENALLDIKAKDLGVPVYALFGGPVRSELPLYWSHCGGYRLRFPDILGVDPVRGPDDLVALGRLVKSRGFKALKTNIFRFDMNPPVMHHAGFARGPGFPELNADPVVLAGVAECLAAFRQGMGPEMGLMLDTNFHFKTDGFIKVARACEPFNLSWIEIDTYDPEGLRLIRDRAAMPVASCESLFGRRQYRPFFENRSMDVAIIDVPWNGLAEAIKIAMMADAYEINCAPHNFYGHLSTMMSAHMAAVIPNLAIMETDIDDVPWKDDLVTQVPVISNGNMAVPTAPGWGTEVNEEALKAHPPKAPHS
ncbi:MAG TPA: mandelate racemase/muconate lactonizing enzyme family protein [Rhizomicrobium sp.]|nr:mandelate racemase/muconate lactonizing enzyme family protein [Rhizomicrobium sp.]